MNYTNLNASDFDGSKEILCPVCGGTLTDKEKIKGGWNCKCGEFVPEGMEVNPYKGVSNQHKMNARWR